MSDGEVKLDGSLTQHCLEKQALNVDDDDANLAEICCDLCCHCCSCACRKIFVGGLSWDTTHGEYCELSFNTGGVHIISRAVSNS